MLSLIKKNVDLETALAQTSEKGYYFHAEAIKPYYCIRMKTEIESLILEEGNHVLYPLNPGLLREVRQLHERAYFPVGHKSIPIATEVSHLLANQVKEFLSLYPALKCWHPTEAGYQRYRDTKDWISPHRDRRNDQLLSATITIDGSAMVRIHEPVGHPDDYSNLRQVDEFRTFSGTIMLLRAPGFGSGQQVIHEVLSPEIGSRLILNLRMRPDILKSPQKFEAQRK